MAEKDTRKSKSHLTSNLKDHTLESKILHAQKLESLGVLAGAIAHDFNNLLVSILGNAELALMDLPQESPVRNCIENILTVSIRASELVKQMLTYSGKGKFNMEALDLETIIVEMGHLLEIAISKKVELKYNFGKDVLPVQGDATQIRQIVMNLITNASEAIGNKNGRITVVTGTMECDQNYFNDTYIYDDLPEGIYTYLEITDTGSGMAEKTISKIFDPFYTTKFTGRGLGLAAVLGIIKDHKGTIKIYSELNKGTSFKVIFPAVNAVQCSEKKLEEDFQVKFSGMTILLVDDEESVLNTGSQILERLGFRVLTAKDGQEALNICVKDPNRISLILLDFTMPNMDGEECFDKLQLIRKDVKVILTSGHNEQELSNRFSDRGFAGFIQKPYMMKHLTKKLSEVLVGVRHIA